MLTWFRLVLVVIGIYTFSCDNYLLLAVCHSNTKYVLLSKLIRIQTCLSDMLLIFELLNHKLSGPNNIWVLHPTKIPVAKTQWFTFHVVVVNLYYVPLILLYIYWSKLMIEWSYSMKWKQCCCFGPCLLSSHSTDYMTLNEMFHTYSIQQPTTYWVAMPSPLHHLNNIFLTGNTTHPYLSWPQQQSV